MVYINKELLDFSHITNARELHDYVTPKFAEGGDNYLLIDEVQDIDGYEDALRNLHAEDRCQIIVTGSNAYIFSSEKTRSLKFRVEKIPRRACRLDPHRLQVHTLDFSWQIGFQGRYNGRRTASSRPDFTPINASHTSLALRGQFKLPYGIGISTDFSVFMRRGYGSSELDTTDPVWNARVSYEVPKTGLIVMFDGFDMLYRLSSVDYAVTAQGRTVTFTNVLPRYFMLHLQYRLNILPKRR